MKLNDQHRSMIATAFVGAFDPGLGHGSAARLSLCCAPDAVTACAQIVGKRHAEKLREFIYERCGCGGFESTETTEYFEQLYLDKIAGLETL